MKDALAILNSVVPPLTTPAQTILCKRTLQDYSLAHLRLNDKTWADVGDESNAIRIQLQRDQGVLHLIDFVGEVDEISISSTCMHANLQIWTTHWLNAFVKNGCLVVTHLNSVTTMSMLPPSLETVEAVHLK